MSCPFHPQTNIGPGFDNEPVPFSNEPQATQQEEAPQEPEESTSSNISSFTPGETDLNQVSAIPAVQPAEETLNDENRRASNQQSGGSLVLLQSEEVEDGHSTTTAPNTSGRRKKRRVNVEEEDIVSRPPHTYVSPASGILTVSDLFEGDETSLKGYRDSLDSMLYQNREDYEWSEARKKISSTLVEIGFPDLLLLSKEAAEEIGALASKLSKDPSISPEKIRFLKLMESLPMMSQEFRANKAIMEEAEAFFTALDSNLGKAGLLGMDFDILGKQLSTIDIEVNEKTHEIREIDAKMAPLQAQMAPLQAKKTELMNFIESKQAEKVHLSFGRTVVTSSMKSTVKKVQDANSKKPEWVVKKENAQKITQDIISKVSPFNGFSL